VNILLICVFWLTSASAESQEKIETFPAFKEATLNDNKVCKYTYGTQLKGHNGLPPLFANVEGVYIKALAIFMLQINN